MPYTQNDIKEKDKIVIVDIGNTGNRFEETFTTSDDLLFELIKIDDSGIKCYYVGEDAESTYEDEEGGPEVSDQTAQSTQTDDQSKKMLNIPLSNYWRPVKREGTDTGETGLNDTEKNVQMNETPENELPENELPENKTPLGESPNAYCKRQIFTKDPDIIEERLQGGDLAIIVCAVSQFMTGTIAMKVIKKAKKLGIFTIVISTDEYLDKKPQGTLEYDLQHFRKEADAVFTIWDEDRCLNTRDPYSSYVLYDHRKDYIKDLICAVVSTIVKRGYIDLYLSDFEFVIGDKEKGYIGFGAGKDEHMALNAVKNALKMCHFGADMKEIDMVLLNIDGDVTLIEVNEAYAYIKKCMSWRTKIIFGISENVCFEGCTAMLIAMK